MALIISKNGKNAKKIEKSVIDKEDYLQRYIYNNPETIPLYEIKEDIRICILGREAVSYTHLTLPTICSV